MPKLEGIIEGGALSWREQGKGGPPVLLVHGAGGSASPLSELLNLLGRERRTVAVDLPGHGDSAPFSPRPRLEELLERYRDALAELAERIGLGRFVIAGHSMGGAVAQLFALAYPDRLAAAVLIATSARLKVGAPLLETLEKHFDKTPELLAAAGFSPTTDRAQARSWAESYIQRCEQQQMIDDFRACATFDIRDRLGEIDLPVTVVSAADDMLTPPKLQQQLVEGLGRRGKLELITRVGHFVYLERPDVVARVISGACEGGR